MAEEKADKTLGNIADTDTDSYKPVQTSKQAHSHFHDGLIFLYALGLTLDKANLSNCWLICVQLPFKHYYQNCLDSRDDVYFSPSL